MKLFLICLLLLVALVTMPWVIIPLAVGWALS